jgi:diguanylate cyclase (GGDEF)-like protein
MERGRLVLAVVTGIDEYQMRLLRPAHAVLAAAGYSLVVHVDGPDLRALASPLLGGVLEELRPVGVLLTNLQLPEEQEQAAGLLQRLDIVAVHVGSRVPGECCVHGENEIGMRELMAHLIHVRRARRMVLIRGTPHQEDSQIRESVFREELTRCGLPVEDELVLTGNFSPEYAYKQLSRLLERRQDFDAVVAANDVSALGAMAALSDAGLRVPEDVAVTGFDNDEAAGNWPGLTTVDQDLASQGAAAANVLLARLRDEDTAREMVIPSRLVVRGSTAPRGSAAIVDLAAAVNMARSQKVQLADRDGILATTRALVHCWTIEQAVQALEANLHRIGVVRCFLAVHEGEGSVRLVMDHHSGVAHEPPPGRFPAADLLPPAREDELNRGMLVLQPLNVMDRQLGYLLYEQMTGSVRVNEAIRTDLSRTLDAIFSTQRLQDHAATLERLVARRTSELEAEVATRSRAEQDLQRVNAELQRSLMLDGPTGIANRSAFTRHLDRHWQLQSAAGTDPLALLLVDVDLFKPYNDRYGHLRGDEALYQVAQCLQAAATGRDDLACRFGGEEFAAVLPRTGLRGAVAVAERFQRLLAERAIEHASSPVATMLTASVGIAISWLAARTDWVHLVEAADEALYEAKAQGRDRFAVRAEPPPPGQPGQRGPVPTHAAPPPAAQG